MKSNDSFRLIEEDLAGAFIGALFAAVAIYFSAVSVAVRFL